VKAFKFHKQKWPETFSLDFENHIGTLGVEEDLYAILNMYCKHLTEIRIMATQPINCGPSLFDPSTCSIFVMTITDNDMANNVSRLMDASLQLLATVKLMETQLTKRKQSMSAQAVATVTERVYKQQEQVTQEIQAHHAQQQIFQKLQEHQQLQEPELTQNETFQCLTNVSETMPEQNEGKCEQESNDSPESALSNIAKDNINLNSELIETPDIEAETGHEDEVTDVMQSSL
jgi:hypothetical protein